MKAIIATTLMLILLGLPNQQSLDPDLLAMEREIANLVNVHRESLGLDVLEFTEAINQVARQHSFDMASEGLILVTMDFPLELRPSQN